MLKHGEINPLNVHGLRRLDWCPPHFTQVTLPGIVQEKIITDWLYENLSGRFYLGLSDKIANSNEKSFQRQTVIGFEVSSEASYFSLFLPQIIPASYQ